MSVIWWVNSLFGVKSRLLHLFGAWPQLLVSMAAGRPIFMQSDDIRSQLPEDSKRFELLDNSWKDTSHLFSWSAQCTSLTSSVWVDIHIIHHVSSSELYVCVCIIVFYWQKSASISLFPSNHKFSAQHAFFHSSMAQKDRHPCCLLWHLDLQSKAAHILRQILGSRCRIWWWRCVCLQMTHVENNQAGKQHW